MSRPNLTALRLPGSDDPSSRPGEPDAPGSIVPSNPAAYSRFSLALVRQPPEIPYTGNQVVKGPDDVAPFLHQLLAVEPYECLGALLLTARDHPMGHTIPFRGAITSCRVEPRALLVTALLTNAVSLVAFHLHPSGDPTPSPEDLEFATRLGLAGKMVGVGIKDFVILGEAPAYWSLWREDAIVSPSSPRRRTRKPKYRHPDDPTQTWAGTGFMPVWLREEIEDGASLENFLVDGARVTEAAARQEREVRERTEVKMNRNRPARRPSPARERTTS